MLSNRSFFFHQVEREAGSPGIERAGESRNGTCEVILAPLLRLAEVPELVAEGGGNARPSRAAESGRNACPGAALKRKYAGGGGTGARSENTCREAGRCSGMKRKRAPERSSGNP
jgi:hypothetical protein